jgi:hypothetical protein
MVSRFTVSDLFQDWRYIFCSPSGWHARASIIPAPPPAIGDFKPHGLTVRKEVLLTNEIRRGRRRLSLS